MKTDSGLRAYCHGNVDFPNVWERCWPTRAIPIRESVDSLCRDDAYTKGLSPLCDIELQ